MSTSLRAESTTREEQAATWAVRLADGELSPAHQAELRAWLDIDPANASALDEIVGVWRAVEEHGAAPQMMAMREAALASARRSLRGNRMPPTRRTVWGLLAATLVLAVGGTGLWAWNLPDTYRTSVGERRTIMLEDGSKLSLDGATEVEVLYRGDRRRLKLDSGRAKFEVAKDSLRPFSVSAGDKMVVATGTAFSVERVGDQVRVVLYEGSVALLRKQPYGKARAMIVGAQSASAEAALTPGREAVMTLAATGQAADTAMVTTVDPVRSLAWERGRLVFEDEPLRIALERMNRYAQTPLALADVGLGDTRISGVFVAGDTQSMVQGLDAAFQISARRDGDTLVLFRRGADAPPD